MTSLTLPPCPATSQSFSSKGAVKVRQACVAEFSQLSHVTNSNRNATPRQRRYASPPRLFRTQGGTHRLGVIYEARCPTFGLSCAPYVGHSAPAARSGCRAARGLR